MFYFDTVLVMGQRNAGMACSRATDAVMFIHRKRGHDGANYLDDLIGVAAPSNALALFVDLGATLSLLGLLENGKKAFPPSSRQMVLGVELDTFAGTISVSSQRMDEVQGLLHDWNDKASSSKKELQRLIGKLSYISKCVRQSRLFLNRMLHTL